MVAVNTLPIQFERNHAEAPFIGMIFATTAALNAWLTNPTRYAGQTCSLVEAGVVTQYVLNAAKTAWNAAGGGGAGGAEAWVTATAYVIDDQVFDPLTHKTYICITAHTSSAAFNTDVAKWTEFSAGGFPTWITGNTYIIGNRVYDPTSGKLYICTGAHTAAAAFITDIANWQVIADGSSFETTLFDSSNEINGPVTHMASLQEAYSHMSSAGPMDGFALTDNADGTVSIALGVLSLRGGVTTHDGLLHVNMAASGVLLLTDDSINYITIDYNAGTPQWVVSTAVSSFNGTTKVLVYFLTREGNIIKYVDTRDKTVDFANKADAMFRAEKKFRHAEGGSLVGAIGLAPTVTIGEFFSGVNPIAHPAFDCSIAGTANENVFELYQNRAAWSETLDVKLIDNVNYDLAGTPTALGTGKWKVVWAYALNDTPTSLTLIEGDTQYNNQAAAELDPKPSSLPTSIDGVGVLLGRYLVQEGVATVISQSDFDTDFAASGVLAHNELSGLQGGTADEYYHDTAAENARQLLLEKESEVLYQENFRLNDHTIFTDTANVVTSSNTGNPIGEDRSLKVTVTTGVTGNGTLSPEVTITEYMREFGTVGLNSNTRFDGSLGNMELFVEFYNGADWTTLQSRTFRFRAGSNFNRFLLNLDSTCTKIRYTPRVVDAGSYVLEMGLIKLASNPLPTIESVTVEEYNCSDSVLYSSANLAVPYFNTVAKDSLSLLGTVVNDSTNGFIFTASSRCKVVMTHRNAFGAAGYMGISKNATAAELDTSIASIPEEKMVAHDYCSGLGEGGSATFSGVLEVGESLAAHVSLGETSYTSAGMQGISLTASAVSANVVFEGVATDKEWTDFVATSSWDTWATTTGKYRRDGDQAEIEIKVAVTAAPTGSLTVSVPAFLTTDTAKMVHTGSSTNRVGDVTISDTGSRSNILGIAMYNNTTTVSAQAHRVFGSSVDVESVAPTTPHTFANTDFVVFKYKVPIVGWSVTDPLLSVPVTNEVENVYTLNVNHNSVGVIDEYGEGVAWATLKSHVTGVDTYSLNTDMYTVFPKIVAVPSEDGTTYSDGTAHIRRRTFPDFEVIRYTTGGILTDMGFDLWSKKSVPDYISPKGYYLGDFPKVVHSNDEVWSGERWITGARIMMRSFDLSLAVASGASVTLTTVDIGLVVLDLICVAEDATTGQWIKLSGQSGGAAGYIYYDDDDGNIKVRCDGFTLSREMLTIKYLEP